MVRYIVSIRHLLTLYSVNKTLFDAAQLQELKKTSRRVRWPGSRCTRRLDWPKASRGSARRPAPSFGVVQSSPMGLEIDDSTSGSL